MKLKLRTNCLLYLALAAMILPIATLEAFAESTSTGVVTSEITKVNYPAAVRYQPKIFYTQGRYWVFFVNFTDADHGAYYTTSSDGKSWTTPVSLGPTRYDRGEALAAWYNGTTFTIVDKVDYPHPILGLEYRCGFPHPDGTIGWIDNWAYPWDLTPPIINGSIGGTDHYLAVDSKGYPWIAWELSINGVQTLNITKSDRNDGTWHTAAGYPYTLAIGNGTSCYRNPHIIPLSNGRLYVIAELSSQPLHGWCYNGISWSSVENVSTSNVVYEYGQETWCDVPLASANDDINLVFMAQDFSIRYVNRSNVTGIWGNEILVEPCNNITSTPTMTIDLATDTLTVFWKDYPTFGNIFFKRCIDGVWDAEPSLLVAENYLADPYYYYNSDGDSTLNCVPNIVNSYAALLYVTASTPSLQPPFTLKVAFLPNPSYTPPPTPEETPAPTPSPTANPILTPTPKLTPTPTSTHTHPHLL